MLLELKNISKKFKIGDKEKFYALHDINIGFNKGEFVSIIGPSGCGKSTLLNLIAGLDIPSEGELIISGKNSKKFKGKDWDLYRKNNIGFIFQNFNLIEHLSALENVEIVMNLIGLSFKTRHQRALALLKKVGLEHHANHRPSELSGGQKQRVAIARALANDPDILLMDEPTGALDSKTGIQIMNLIKEIAADKLVIMVTHNDDLAEEYASRLVKLRDGEIIDDVSLHDVDINNIKSDLKKKNKSMSFYESFKLSLRNMGKKKGRLAITTIASCIGIAGLALIMGLGNGANIYIDKQLNKFASANVIAVQDNVKKKNEAGMKLLTTSNDEADYKDIFKRSDVAEHRPRLALLSSNAIINSKNINIYFMALSNEKYLDFVKENLDGNLPKENTNQILINQASARAILEANKIDSDNIKDAIGKTLTVQVNINDEMHQTTNYSKDFVVSGIVNEIDLGLTNVYYNYDYVTNWLKGITINNKTAYDYAKNGFEITIKDVNTNKQVADYINDTANGGIGSNVTFASSNSSGNAEGYFANSITIAFKTIFARLITIAQLVIGLFIIVALAVSSIMTAIVLYSSVVERKTEIGIIKAVGGRNKDVLRIFESEAILMGVFSGILGLIVAYCFKPIIEFIILHYFNLNLPDIISIPISKVPLTDLSFPFATYICLIAFSALISAIAGRLPSKKATKMQVIDALRDE